MYVYETIYDVDDRNYVGKCIASVEKSSNYYGSGKLIRAAIKKYGKENFTKVILEVLPEGSTAEQLYGREQYWIEKQNSKYPVGFNLTDGGAGTTGLKHSQATKDKIGKSNIGKTSGKKSGMFGVHRYGREAPMFGKKHSKETKEMISKSHIANGVNKGENNPFYGKKHSKETLERIKLKRRDFSGKNNPFYGKKHSKTSRELMSKNDGKNKII